MHETYAAGAMHSLISGGVTFCFPRLMTSPVSVVRRSVFIVQVRKVVVNLLTYLTGYSRRGGGNGGCWEKSLIGRECPYCGSRGIFRKKLQAVRSGRFVEEAFASIFRVLVYGVQVALERNFVSVSSLDATSVHHDLMSWDRGFLLQFVLF